VKEKVINPKARNCIYQVGLQHIVEVYGCTEEGLTPEEIARVRRILLFEKSTGFYRYPGSRSIPEAFATVPEGCFDNRAIWTNGESFILIAEWCKAKEPPDCGLPFIQIPEALSPYCGCWDKRTAATPCTRSLLYAKPEDTDFVDKLKLRLFIGDWDAPRWNALDDKEVNDHE
jgi:hypothetical protein